MDRVLLERLLGEGLSLAEVGRRVGRHESTVAYWLDRYGLRALGHERHAAKGGLDRALLEALVGEGLSIAEIAERVDRSKATVRHWLVKHGLSTAAAGGRRPSPEAQAAKEAGLTEAVLRCAKHGTTLFVLDRRGYYRCKRCRSAAVSKRRRNVKATLVREAGGACRLCGYSRCLSALEFHHIEPSDKAFALSQQGVTRSLAIARAEAETCVLLCANCHAEVEVGFVQLDRGTQAGVQSAAEPTPDAG